MRDQAETSHRTTAPCGQPASAGVLVCDSKGTIVSCSDTAAQVFGGTVTDLEGSTIWYLISGGAPNKTPPGFKKDYLAKLSANRGWHRFHAINHKGGEFPVEFSMLKIDSANERLFLLNLRHANVA